MYTYLYIIILIFTFNYEMVHLKDKIIECFKLMIFKVQKDNPKGAHFKIKAYNDVCKALLETDTYPHTFPEIKQILLDYGMKNPTKTLEKIKEIIETGTLQQVEGLKWDTGIQALRNLTKVYGIGPKNAMKLYEEQGIFTVNVLKEAFAQDSTILNNKQALGLKYYDDLQKKIPRSEMDVYKKTLHEAIHELRTELRNPDIHLSINGSYRRGKSQSGDIDVLITGEGDTSYIRKAFIKKILQKKVLIETLANGKKKFMGISKLPHHATYRHMDIIDTSEREYAFAQLYFTGSAGFNTKMRNIALKKGYSLNEYRLSYKTTKKSVEDEEYMKKLGQFYCKTEKDIFRFLDMEYVHPTERKDIILSKYLN